MEKHKDALFQVDTIVPGKIIMDVNSALGIYAPKPYNPSDFSWVKDLVPTDHIHSQYLIYEISSETADSLRAVKTLGNSPVN
jgi:hypothetical protein